MAKQVKTFDVPTLSSKTGAMATLPAAGSTVVTTTGTQTLTNKTLTSPTETAPAISGAATVGTGATFTNGTFNTPTITAPAITGATTIGTGATVTNGTFNTPTITAPAITGAMTVGTGASFTNGTFTTPIMTLATQTVAALGSSISDAAAITATAPGTIWVTGANNAVGVVLPASAAGKVYKVKNDDTANNILKVYAPVNSTINAIAANSAFNMAAKTSCDFVCHNATAWYTVPLVAS